MYLNQWTKNLEVARPYNVQYYFYLHDIRTHETASYLNTFLGIYEK